jgi:hypothetical protein
MLGCEAGPRPQCGGFHGLPAWLRLHTAKVQGYRVHRPGYHIVTSEAAPHSTEMRLCDDVPGKALLLERVSAFPQRPCEGGIGQERDDLAGKI